MKQTKVAGYLEYLSSEVASGWAASTDENDSVLQVRVTLENKVIAVGSTKTERKDVAKKYSKKSSKSGFEIRLSLSDEEVDKVSVETFDGENWCPLKRATSRSNSSNTYQDFDGNGSSKSHEKLKALRLFDIVEGRNLSTPLHGLRILDIGCNEGFFCHEAIRQGASHVVGVDQSATSIKAAKKRTPEAEFHVSSWWNLPDGQFDVIFFLSAIHYEKEQKKLLSHLVNKLSPTGVLVLECGVAPGSANDGWLVIDRWDGPKRYPYWDYLIDELLSDYAVRPVGRSVDQTGDPIPRHVFHCRPKRSTAIIVSGMSHDGKTSLVRNFHSNGFPAFRCDMFLLQLLNSPMPKEGSLAAKLQGLIDTTKQLDLAQLAISIVGSDVLDELAVLMADSLPTDADVFFLEGDILRHAKFFQAVKRQLINRGVRVWSMARSS